MKKPKIYFYIPTLLQHKEIPQDVNLDWSGFQKGVFAWTLQTYMHLKEIGYDCHLTDNLSAEGIIISHRGLLTDFIIPSRKQLFICILADWDRHPFALLHIVQNNEQTFPHELPRIVRIFMPGLSCFIRHWLQPGLKPRSKSNSLRFKNLAYIGRKEQLAPELLTEKWNERIASLGLQWKIIDNCEKWCDYSDIDAIIAIRSLDNQQYNNKPATKLFNAWHAGVIPICGNDSAFMHEKRSNLDFIHATDIEELYHSIIKLQNDTGLRQKILENAINRAEEISNASICKDWINFFESTAVNVYLKWTTQSMFKYYGFILFRFLALITYRIIAIFRNIRTIYILKNLRKDEK